MILAFQKRDYEVNRLRTARPCRNSQGFLTAVGESRDLSSRVGVAISYIPLDIISYAQLDIRTRHEVIRAGSTRVAGQRYRVMIIYQLCTELRQHIEPIFNIDQTVVKRAVSQGDSNVFKVGREQRRKLLRTLVQRLNNSLSQGVEGLINADFVV